MKSFKRTVAGAFTGRMAGALMALSTMFVMDVQNPKPANATTWANPQSTTTPPKIYTEMEISTTATQSASAIRAGDRAQPTNILEGP